MEWIDGIKLSDIQTLKSENIEVRDLGLNLLKFFADMIFYTGFVHGDPHPGNFLIQTPAHLKKNPDESPSQEEIPQYDNVLGQLYINSNTFDSALGGLERNYRVVLLDHGYYLKLEDYLRETYCETWCCFVLNNTERALQVFKNLVGEQHGEIIHNILGPAKNEAKKRSLQDVVRDMTHLLDYCPKPLIEALRIQNTVRQICAPFDI